MEAVHPGDFAPAAGMVPDPETLFLPKLMTMFAARAAGITPLGCSVPSPTIKIWMPFGV